MITRLDLQNFQSHKNTTLNFSDGVNIIIGSSDSGKTSIIRALKLAVWNRPLGDAFIRHGEEQSSIMVGLNDDIVIERAKGKNDHYKIHKENNVIEFKAFGHNPPEEIETAFRISELNLQSQLDSPFLLSENPGEVSRHFNRIANIDKIDSSLKNIEKWLRKINQDINAAEDEIKRLEEQHAEFDYLEKAEQKMEALTTLDSQRNTTQKKIHSITKIIEQLATIDESLSEHEQLASYDKKVQNVLDLYKKKTEAEKNFLSFANTFKQLADCVKQTKKYKQIASRESELLKLLKLQNNLSDIDAKITALNKLTERLPELDLSIERAKDNLNDLEKEWHEIMPDTCPLCGGPTQ